MSSRKPATVVVRTTARRASMVSRSKRSRLRAKSIGWKRSLQELRDGNYRPQPLLRVWIPKSNGGRCARGIPCIRDRVVMMAVVLVIGPIFEADLLDNQYGFRTGLDAKMAVRRVFWHITKWRRRGGDRRRLARLLHFNSTWSVDALPDTPYCRRKTPPRHQKLADSDGGGASRTTDNTHGGSTEDQERNPAGLTVEPAYRRTSTFRRFLLRGATTGTKTNSTPMSSIMRMTS